MHVTRHHEHGTFHDGKTIPVITASITFPCHSSTDDGREAITHVQQCECHTLSDSSSLDWAEHDIALSVAERRLYTQPVTASQARFHAQQTDDIVKVSFTRRTVQLKCHGSSFLVVSSRECHEDVTTMSRGNRACRICRTRMLLGSSQRCRRVGRVGEDVTRILRGKCCRGIPAEGTASDAARRSAVPRKIRWERTFNTDVVKLNVADVLLL